jgi:3',5'-cyclic AMP phosphodiesterase CpdA
VTIVQLTDTHVLESGKRQWLFFETSSYLARCVARINALQPAPDLVIVTGDVADGGKRAQYERARAVLDELTVPYFIVPGNHDRAKPLADVFGERVRATPDAGLSYTIDDFPVRVVMLDSTARGRPGGEISDAKCAWLDGVLARERARPTILALHHPPFAPKVPGLDRLPLRGRMELGAIVARHPQIRRIVSGHVHHAFVASWCGTTASTAMSSSPQLFPRSGFPFGINVALERPGFQSHRFDGSSFVSRSFFVG